jgi:putative peptide zinc metalloprotease protein
VNHLAISTIFVTSASTVMFNGKPLLRYDGYYIVSDVLEIPNLRQKAGDIVHRLLSRWCLGLELPPDPFLPQRRRVLFAAYAVAAGVYKWIVAVSVLWFLHKLFEPYRLEVIGQALAVLSLVTLVGVPLWRAARFLMAPGRTHEVKRLRLCGTLALVVGALAGIAFVPLPHRVWATLEIQARDAQGVYVDVPGTLEEIGVRPGDPVRPGQTLARLASVDVELAIAELAAQRDEQALQLENLRRQKFRDKASAAQAPQVEESLRATEEQLRRRRTDLARLALAAPAAGTVLAPPSVPRRPPADGRLAAWSGTPLEERNLGAYLPQGTLLCQIGDQARLQANLVIDQADIEFVREGQAVELKLDQLPHESLAGTIAEIARLDLKIAPRRLSNKAGGDVATRTDEAGQERLQSASYQAQVPLDNTQGLLRVGLTGQAKVHAGWQTLGQRLARYLARTFHFKL